MSSRFASVSLALALVACAVEHGNKPPQQEAGGDQAGGTAQGASPGPMHTVFSRVRDTVALGVERMTLDLMLPPEMDRKAQQAAMQKVLDAVRQQDTTLAAIRVLGFYPPTTVGSSHPTGMAMVPSAIVEWVPAGGAGWNGVSAANARGPHTTDVLFVSDLPNHQRAPGAGARR